MARDRGFTLLELVVVIAGLGILASLAIPNFLRMLEGSQNDEAASFMNTLAAECLQVYRSQGDSALDKIAPDTLGRSGVPREFQLEEGFDKCRSIIISPKQKGETTLAAYGFEIKTANGKSPYIYKFGRYSHPDAEQACRNWASFKPGTTERHCDEGGDVAAIRARLAAEAAERERLRQIQLRYDAWLKGPPPGTGNYTADGKDVWAFQGNVVSNKAEFDKVVERECGKELVTALDAAKASKADGPFSYTGKNGGCSINTYLCSGADVGTKEAYDACKERERQERCNAAEGRWKESGVNGRFSEPGCEAKWQCNKLIYSSQSDYNSSTCALPPPPPPKTCKTPDIWYCPWRPTWKECQPVCS